jgi:hypothetical protein
MYFMVFLTEQFKKIKHLHEVFFKLGKTASEKHDTLQRTFGEAALSKAHKSCTWF